MSEFAKRKKNLSHVNLMSLLGLETILSPGPCLAPRIADRTKQQNKNFYPPSRPRYGLADMTIPATLRHPNKRRGSERATANKHKRIFQKILNMVILFKYLDLIQSSYIYSLQDFTVYTGG